MSRSTILFICAGIALVAVARPVEGQKKELVQLQMDVIRLQQQVTQLQSAVDEKNAVTRTLVEKVADQVNGLLPVLNRLSASLDEAKTRGDKNAADVRTIVTSLSANIDQLADGLGGVRSQLNSLAQQVSAMKTTAEPLATPESLMRTAAADLLAGNYELAISGFKEFLAKFPNDPRTAEAQMFIADAYYNQKKFEQAVIEYDLLLQKQPNSDKTVTALYKKGLSQLELKQPQQALANFKRVTTEFPGTSEAAGAQLKIKELTAAPARRPR